MTMAPAARNRATAVESSDRLIAESRTGRGRRQTGDVDIVLHRNRDAIQRQRDIAGCAKRAGFGQHVGFRSQADEDSGITVRADAGEAARGRLFWRYCPSPMRCHDRGDGLNQIDPRMQSDERPDKGALFFVRKFLSPRNTQNRGVILILSKTRSLNFHFEMYRLVSDHWLASHPADIEPVSARIIRNSGIFKIASGDFQPGPATMT